MDNGTRPGWLTEAVDYAEGWLDFQMRQTETPGAVFAVVDAQGLVAERAFGFADLADRTPITPRHLFRVASHSKTFTAAGILLLHESGRLHLDDPIGLHVDGLDPTVGAATISQLLSHSAGLMRDVADTGHWQDRRPFPNAAELRAELTLPLSLVTNSRFKYSNLGFGLLGLAIEGIAGELYGAWMVRNVIGPAGLAATTPDIPMTEVAPMATGHGGRMLLGRRFPVPGLNMTHALASATGFTSTAGDLARFMASLHPAAPSSILSPASRREMTRPQWRMPHMEQERHYGLGTMGGAVQGWTWFGHSGSFQRFMSRTVCMADWGIAVSVVINAIDGPATPWSDGVLGILNRFAIGGAAKPALRVGAAGGGVSGVRSTSCRSATVFSWRHRPLLPVVGRVRDRGFGPGRRPHRAGERDGASRRAGRTHAHARRTSYPAATRR